jgi:hypothetical protein
MEGLHPRLRTWFRAIGEVPADAATQPERPQEVIEVPRVGTVRKLLQKIFDGGPIAAGWAASPCDAYLAA